MKSVLDRLFPTLGSRIAVSVSLVFFVAGSGFLFFAHRTGYSMLEKIARAKAHGVAEFEKSIVEHLMLEGKHNHVKDALEAAITSRQATDVFILKYGDTVAMSARPNIGSLNFPLRDFSSLQEYEGDRFKSVKENGSMFEYVATPIAKKPECYRCHQQAEKNRGYIVVKVSLDDVRAIAVQHRTTNIIMTIITFIGLGGVIFTTLLFLVIRPVAKLQSQMQEMEDQLERVERGEVVEFSQLQPSHTHDEISSLITMYNKLVRRLNQAHSKLHEMHETQLEHADRLTTVGEMAASIAHEIKNPVAGVLGALKVMDSAIQDRDPQKRIMKQMIAHMERMGRTVDDLLQYARPTHPTFEKVNFNKLVEQTLLLLKPQFKGKNISTELILDKTQLFVKADPKLLQQVLWNILLNAVQAIQSDGKITIITKHEGSRFAVQVHDTGNGIPKEIQSKLFQPFITTKNKGTGLGLAISRRIVEQNEGTISLESSEEKGTLVTIRFPISNKSDNKHAN